MTSTSNTQEYKCTEYDTLGEHIVVSQCANYETIIHLYVRDERKGSVILTADDTARLFYQLGTILGVFDERQD